MILGDLGDLGHLRTFRSFSQKWTWKLEITKVNLGVM